MCPQKPFLFASFVLVLNSCASTPIIKSSSDKATAATGDSPIAVYYLPRKYIRLTAHFNEQGTLKPQEALGTQKNEFAEIVVPSWPVTVTETSGNDYSEKITVETADGFLSKVTTDVTDQRIPAFEAFIAKIPTLGNTTPGALASKSPPGRQSLEISYLFDPTATDAEAKFKSSYPDAGLCLVSREILDSHSQREKIGTPASMLEHGLNGVVVPMASTYTLELYAIDGPTCPAKAAGTPILTLTTLVPDPNLVVRLDVNRTAWIEHKTTLTFDKGVFKSAEIDRGSVTAELFKLPIDIAKLIISVPAEMVQLRINTNKSDKALVDAQKDLIDSQKQLLDERKKLDDERAAAKKSASDGDAGGNAPVKPQ